MKTFDRYLWYLCLLCFSLSGALAQKVGTTSMQFLKVMPCARATAMGDAYSVLASGAEAAFWNPGGVALAQHQELSATYINWILDSRQGALSYATTFGDLGAVGLQIQYVDFGEFEETSTRSEYMSNEDHPGITGRTFRPFSYLVGLTYARNMTDRFSTGITVKYAHESLYNGSRALALISTSAGMEKVDTWGSGLLFDFGLRYNTGFRSIRIGASVQNFGSEIKYAKEASLAPLLFRFGGAVDLIGSDGLFSVAKENRITLAFDLFQPNDYSQQAHMGVEYEFAEAFALRAGYKFNYDYENLTLGAGVKHTIGAVTLAIDYSYGSIGTYLGNVQRISLGAGIQ